jgi:hypothetical protein
VLTLTLLKFWLAPAIDTLWLDGWTTSLSLTLSLSSMIHLATPSKGQMDCWQTASANLGFGGKQPMMRVDTKISDAATELGMLIDKA